MFTLKDPISNDSILYHNSEYYKTEDGTPISGVLEVIHEEEPEGSDVDLESKPPVEEEVSEDMLGETSPDTVIDRDFRPEDEVMLYPLAQRRCIGFPAHASIRFLFAW